MLCLLRTIQKVCYSKGRGNGWFCDCHRKVIRIQFGYLSYLINGKDIKFMLHLYRSLGMSRDDEFKDVFFNCCGISLFEKWKFWFFRFTDFLSLTEVLHGHWDLQETFFFNIMNKWSHFEPFYSILVGFRKWVWFSTCISIAVSP